MGDLRDWSPEPNGTVLEEREPTAAAETTATATIGAEYWQRAEEATQGIISQVYPFRSVPLKTCLPDGDIDLTAFGGLNVEEALANDVCSVLEREDQKQGCGVCSEGCTANSCRGQTCKVSGTKHCS